MENTILMKKTVLALLCALALTVGLLPSAQALPDEAGRAADRLYTLGLVKGTGGSSGYALSGTATRAQAVTLLVRLAGCTQEAASSTVRTSFRDLPAWADAAIRYAYGRGWVNGTDSAHFRPDAPVSAQAYAAFLLRMLGYSDADGDFLYTDTLTFARHIGLTSRDYTQGTFTRGDLFELTAGALRFTYQGTEETVIGRLVRQGSVSRAAASALGLLDSTLDARQIWEEKSAAVFCLDTYQSQLYLDAQTPSGNASGFFITEDGLAVTNYHAIDGVLAATATLASGEVYPVERVIFYDKSADIAVIRIARRSTAGQTTSAFACLELQSAATVREGDACYTLSNPLGLGLVVSSGIVSCAQRTVSGYTQPCIVNTADISQGSSGGALMNAYGQVVGVTSGAYAYGNSMYLAVPVDPVRTADLSAAGWTLSELSALEAAADEAA